MLLPRLGHGRRVSAPAETPAGQPSGCRGPRYAMPVCGPKTTGVAWSVPGLVDRSSGRVPRPRGTCCPPSRTRRSVRRC